MILMANERSKVEADVFGLKRDSSLSVDTAKNSGWDDGTWAEIKWAQRKWVRQHFRLFVGYALKLEINQVEFGLSELFVIVMHDVVQNAVMKFSQIFVKSGSNNFSVYLVFN